MDRSPHGRDKPLVEVLGKNWDREVVRKKHPEELALQREMRKRSNTLYEALKKDGAENIAHCIPNYSQRCFSCIIFNMIPRINLDGIGTKVVFVSNVFFSVSILDLLSLQYPKALNLAKPRSTRLQQQLLENEKKSEDHYKKRDMG
ncbi:MAG: hypothetical protein VCF25_12885 [Candidatus Poribacteria bacterium]